MFENLIVKHLNADAQESASTETVEATTAIKNEPAPEPSQTAHDDFDWSVDKRNVTSYTKEEKEKYDNVYDNTFVQLNDGELNERHCCWLNKNRCGTEHWF
jgi:small subunit ribosomal protein S1